MKRIGLISDTHSYYDASISKYFEGVDEIWHAGDIGSLDVMDKLVKIAPLRAVYGNIDDHKARAEYPKDLRFDCEGVDVFMTHIGGYPGRYNKRVREILQENPPRLYICGHSHILKIIPDKKLGLLHINPGAAGVHGFHKIKTIVRFTLEKGVIKDLDVVELGLRGSIQ
ncbi:MAG: putative phosphoesterase [Maribacter sp.]|jgi:putative phosphoesterase